MSFLLSCPNCGSRPVDEFRYGGEIREAPEGASPETWRRYLYERTNVKGPQREWWYHRFGCRKWFTATRDTGTNTVLVTGWLMQEAKGGLDAEAHQAGSPEAAGEDFSGAG